MMFDEPTSKTLRGPLQQLVSESVFIGTSSWKYPGWCGQVYDESRYTTRKKFSEARFERECLAEYAEFFPTVFVDAGYYPTSIWTASANRCRIDSVISVVGFELELVLQ